MKIRSVETLLLSPPGDRDPHMKARTMRSAAFILLKTDTEHVGIGETYGGYFVPELVREAVAFYAPILEGADPMETDLLMRRMFFCGKFWARVGLGSIVMSGIESALLDLKGKALGVPAYELLGGRCHESLPCYGTGGPSPWPEAKLAAKVAHYRELGFRAVKLGAGWWDDAKSELRTGNSPREAAELEVRKVEFLHKEFGKDFGLMMDGHMDNLPEEARVWDETAATTVLRALEPYGLEFYEEPLPYTDMGAYRRLRDSTTTTVAGGECLSSPEEWRDWLEKEPFDLPQLDAAFMGGPTAFVKIARLCELKGLPIATHSWAGIPGMAANLHAAFACRNTRILEYSLYNWPDPSELWVEPPAMKNGRLSLSNAPGLGVRLPKDLAKKYPYQPGTGEFNSVKGKVLTT
jgi:galactonate dehydratase